MKLTIKTLKQEELSVEVESSGTILDIKKQVFEKYGHPVHLQKLIYLGKILVDDSTIAQNNIKETDFIVLMVTKAPIAKQEPPKPAPVAQQPAPVVQQPAPQPNLAPSPVVQQPAPQPSVQQPAPVEQARGGVPEELVTQISEMGFDPADVRAALQASFNNPDRAVEYLMNGYPPGVGPNQPAPSQPAPQPSSGGSQNPPNVSGNLFQMAAQAVEQRQNEPSPFDALRNQPNINSLRAMVQQNPQLLQPLLQQLAQTNPQILQLIQQNYQEFIRFISEPVSGEANPNVIQVTPEEKEAIEQLEALGFPRSRVLEAFIACDRDSTAAANYLFENAGDEGSFPIEEDDDDEEWEGSF